MYQTPELDAIRKRIDSLDNQIHDLLMERADLIMANMHAMSPGTEKSILENFYNENKPIEIKLRKDQSPQKNAETF